jgi:hypothetical protein
VQTCAWTRAARPERVDPTDRPLGKRRQIYVRSIMYCPDNLPTILAISLCHRDLVRLADAQGPIRSRDYSEDPTCIDRQSSTMHILHPTADYFRE